MRLFNTLSTMSVSPFLPGNSIWSTNAPSTQQSGAAQTVGGTSAGASSNSLDPSTRPSASERADVSRVGGHPLPNKPSAPGRSNAAVMTRNNAPVSDEAIRSVDSAISNAALRPGVIGGTRTASRGQIQADVSRSNSLAASIQSFHSAHSGSPLPATSHERSNFAQGNLNAQAGLTMGLQSPSIQEDSTMGFHDRNFAGSNETESGTPRLYVDAQHTFEQDDRSASLAIGQISSTFNKNGSGSNIGRPRPKSWMHPAKHDKPSEAIRSAHRDNVEAAFPRPASSQGNHSIHSLNHDGAFGAAPSSKRASSAHFGQAPFDASSSAYDPADPAQASLHAHVSNPTSPGVTSGPLGRGALPNRSTVAAGRATPTLNVPSYMNLSGGLLSPTAATIGSTGASTSHSPVGSPLTGSGFHNSLPHCSVSAGHIFDKQTASAEDTTTESPLIKDMLDRLVRLEGGMKDFSRQISGISRNVSLLLERTKGLPPSSLSNGGGNSSQSAAAASGGNSADDLRSLNAQVSALANSVSHLMTLQGNGLGGAGGGPAPALSGLGLGTTGGMLGTPQLGGPSILDRSASPRVGANPNGSFFPSNALSPRPSGNGRGWSGPSVRAQDQGTDRRWNMAGQAGNARKESAGGPAGSGPAAANLEDGAGPGGLMHSGTGLTQPNAVISKWEHLNLHADLLRSILKYGLGPPNKIQQRALPFLLRGSDIIAQAPPTQERIASYVIPSLQLVLNVLKETGGPGQTASNRGPVALIVSTTVDQATQAQRMALGLGAPLGIRVRMVAASSIDVHQEAQSLTQAWPHIVVGTPQKMSELFTYMTNHASSLHGHGGGPGPSPMKSSEVRLVVLDEVDQLIARNLADHVSTMLRVLPLPTATANVRAAGGLSPALPQSTNSATFSPFDSPGEGVGGSPGTSSTIDRQVALFSNTVPQDVLNFAQSIHLRESVRVLVRRDGAGGGAGSSLMQAPAPGASSILGNNGPGPGMQSVGSQRDMSQPTNALGAHPVNSSVSTAKDPMMAALKGLRQYYLYVAVTSNNGMGPMSPNPGMTHNPAGEMKLDLIADLLEDIEFGQTVIYCANPATQDALIYRLSSKGIEALGLNREMNSYTRQQTLAQFRSSSSQFGTNTMFSSATFAASPGGRARKALVVCETAVNPKEVHQIPLIVFYDMPRSVEDYKDKISCGAAGGTARPSVCVNVVTASGGPRGDVEMLRTLECHLGCKMAELPMDPKHILNF